MKTERGSTTSQSVETCLGRGCGHVVRHRIWWLWWWGGEFLWRFHYYYTQSPLGLGQIYCWMSFSYFLLIQPDSCVISHPSQLFQPGVFLQFVNTKIFPLYNNKTTYLWHHNQRRVFSYVIKCHVTRFPDKYSYIIN
jgi:hypothetical protein